MDSEGGNVASVGSCLAPRSMGYELLTRGNVVLGSHGVRVFCLLVHVVVCLCRMLPKRFA